MLTIEKILLKISLVCALIGIGILILIVETNPPEHETIGQITRERIGQTISLAGEITWVKETPSLSIFSIKDDTGSISVVAFRTELLDLEKKQRVSIEGTIGVYKEDLRIEAKKIQLL